jgi:hypothetical protein
MKKKTRQPRITQFDDMINEIESIIVRDNVTIIDAILHYSEAKGIEPDVIGDIFKRTANKGQAVITLKSRLKEQATKLSMLKK